MSNLFKTSAILAAIFLTACGSPTDPTKENFKGAIQAFLDTKSGLCANAPSQSVPFKLELNNVYSHNGVLLAEALVDAGLLSKSDTKVQAPNGKGMRDAREYQLTESGKTALIKPTAVFDDHAQFCTGKLKVMEITEFAEPRTEDGKLMTSATFTYKVTERAAWADTPSLKNLHRAFREASDQEITQQAVLIQTDKGWVHEMLYKW